MCRHELFACVSIKLTVYTGNVVPMQSCSQHTYGWNMKLQSQCCVYCKPRTELYKFRDSAFSQDDFKDTAVNTFLLDNLNVPNGNTAFSLDNFDDISFSLDN